MSDGYMGEVFKGNIPWFDYLLTWITINFVTLLNIVYNFVFIRNMRELSAKIFLYWTVYKRLHNFRQYDIQNAKLYWILSAHSFETLKYFQSFLLSIIHKRFLLFGLGRFPDFQLSRTRTKFEFDFVKEFSHFLTPLQRFWCRVRWCGTQQNLNHDLLDKYEVLETSTKVLVLTTEGFLI